MTPINHVKFGQMTMNSKLQTLRRNISSRTLSSSNINKMQTSSWDDAKAAREKDKRVSAQDTSSQMNFNQLTDSMGLLNKAFSLGSVQKSNDSSNDVTTTNNITNDNGPSGIAQGVSPRSYNNSSANYNNLSATIDNNNFNTEEFKAYITNNIDPYVNTVNNNLISAKADYNILLAQKDEASANVSGLEEQIGTSETSYKEAEKSLSTNKSDLNSAIASRDEMDKQLSALNSEYSSSCEQVKSAETNKASAQTKVSDCKSDVTKAQTDLQSASATLESAEQVLANTPKTLEDGTINPAYSAAVQARDEAKAKKEAAEQTLTQAQEQLQNAQQELETAEKDLTSAQDSKKQLLQNLSKTESEQSKLADNCLKLENQVETAEQNYDASLEVYDTSKNNYERLNAELESANGILTQCDEYQNKINTIQNDVNKANALKAKAEKALTEKDAQFANQLQSEMTPEEFEKVKQDLLEHSSSSEGCGYNKTILENLIASKDYDISKCSGTLWTPNTMNWYGSASDFEQEGYIKNQDGSFTDPRTGVTMINALKDDYTWVSQEYFAGQGEVIEMGTKSAAGRDFPGLFDTIERNKLQYNAKIGIDGFNSNGEPNFRKMKYRMNGGNID